MSLSSESVTSWTVQPSRWTFAAEKLRAWTLAHLPDDGRVLNACCGPTELGYDGDVVRVDVNESVEVTRDGETETVQIPADHYRDVRSLGDVCAASSFDAVVFDPPFSAHQAASSYGVETAVREDPTTYRVLDDLLKPGGRFISWGFSSRGMPPEYDYDPVAIGHWNTFGRQYDWVSVVETSPGPTFARTTGWSIDVSTDARLNHGPKTTPDVQSSRLSNGGQSISLTYHRLDVDDSIEAAVQRRFDQHRDGVTLLVSPQLSNRHESQLRAVLVSDSRGEWPSDAWYEVDIEELTATFTAGIFDTILYRPCPNAFQHTVEYQGDRTGWDTAVKAEFADLIAPGGTVVQAARTATLMPGDKPYTRTHIEVLASRDHSPDCFISVDELQQASFGAIQRRGVSRPITTTVDVETIFYTGDHTWECPECRGRWARTPAYSVDCPTCGAHRLNYCVTPDGQYLSSPHQARQEAFLEHHERQDCEQLYGSRLQDKDSRSRSSDSAPSGDASERAAVELSEFA